MQNGRPEKLCDDTSNPDLPLYYVNRFRAGKISILAFFIFSFVSDCKKKYTTELEGREDIEKLMKQIWSFSLSAS